MTRRGTQSVQISEVRTAAAPAATLGSAAAGSAPKHPTRRADGRTPNPRTAETAIAAAMNAPREALELLAKPDHDAA